MADGARVTIEGVDEVLKRLRATTEEVRRVGVTAVAQAMGEEMLPKIEARAPVDTGSLKASIVLDVRAKKDHEAVAIIGVDQKLLDQMTGAKGPYDRYLEYGTDNMAARPFLRPGFDEARKDAVDAAFEAFDGFVEGLGEPAA